MLLIRDEAHVRNALARFSRGNFESAAEAYHRRTVEPSVDVLKSTKRGSSESSIKSPPRRTKTRLN